MPLVPGEYDDALTAFLWNNLLGVNWIKFQLALEIIFQERVNHHPSSPKKYPTKKWAHHPQLILVFHTKLHAIWVFPKIVVPQNGWCISWKTLLKWMIWGEPALFLETPSC